MAVGFEEIYSTHRRYVFRVCRQVLRNDADAEEATQETFLKAWRALPRFRGERHGSWLYRIARNQALDQIRRARPGDISLDDPMINTEDGEAFFHQLAAPDSLPVLLLRLDLDRGLRHLKQEAREMITLRIQGLSYEEMAELLGASLVLVRDEMHQGREQLRQAMNRRPQ